MWTWQYVFAILERLGFDDIRVFRHIFLDWALNNAAALFVMRRAYDDVSLRHLNRPGAWLFDSLYTELLVIRGTHQPNVAHLACENRTLLRISRLILSSGSPAETAGVAVIGNQNRNYVGNQMELLAWLAFEDGREELIVGLAYSIQLLESMSAWQLHAMGLM